VPITSAELAAGCRVIVMAAPAASLKLGAGLRIREHYEPLERAVGKPIVRFLG